MLKRLFSGVLLSIFVLSAHANISKARFEHLSSPIRIDWHGENAPLQKSRDFCLQTTDSPEPSELKSSKISYRLRFQSLSSNSGSREIVAISNGNELPLNMSLTTSAGTHEVFNNRDSSTIHGNSFCNGPGKNLRLTVKVSNLEQVPAGDYQAQVKVAAIVGPYQQVSEHTFDVQIHVPEMIRLTVPQEIILDDFRNPEKEVAICVYRNGSGSFNLRATAPGSRDGSFEMVRAGQQPSWIKYNLGVRSRTKGLQNVTPQIPVNDLKGSLHCNSNDLSLIVSVPTSEIERAYAGAYQGQLTINVGVQ